MTTEQTTPTTAPALTDSQRARGLWDTMQELKRLWHEVGHPMLLAAAKDVDERTAPYAPPQHRCDICGDVVAEDALSAPNEERERACPECLELYADDEDEE